MGELDVLRGTMLVCNGSWQAVDPLLAALKLVHLASAHADSLKYIHTDALGYNKCRFGSIPEAALMAKTLIGEKTA